MIAHEPAAQARAGRFPCSPSQVRFWIEEQLTPHNPALNVSARWRLTGRLAHAVLEASWHRLIDRHAALRTAISGVDGVPIQIVEPRVAFAIPIVDVRGLSAAARPAEIERLAAIEARTPFDLATAPLLRVTRLLISDTEALLLVTAHQTVCDGPSMRVLAREMGLICAALAAGVAPVLPALGRSAELTDSEHGSSDPASFAQDRERVETMLRGYEQFELLPDRSRPRRLTSNGGVAALTLERALTDRLGQLARSHGGGLFVTLLSALVTLLYRHTGQNDIVLGVQVDGRDDHDVENAVGCMINTIAIRADVGGDPHFGALLDRMRTIVDGAFACRKLPFAQLIEIARPVRDPSRNALFSVNFSFEPVPVVDAAYAEFSVADLPTPPAGVLFDVNVSMVERPEGWRVAFEYNSDLFEERTMAGLLNRFVILLRSVVADPADTISRLDILPADERAALVGGQNHTQTLYPRDMTLPQLMAEQAARTPHAPAVTCGPRTLSFAQLDGSVTRLAREIAGRGCAPGARVGILLDRSPEMVVAMLAVLRAGCAYVPLDPKFPADRLAFIASDAELSATITRSTLPRDADFPGMRPIFVDGKIAAREDQATPIAGGSPADVAYVIYTSGSTGTPKGVQITHRALVNFLWAMRSSPGLSASDTLVAVTTISFDIAGLELFLPLIVGAKLVIATEGDVIDGRALLQLMQRSRATIVQATPVTWQLLIDAGWRRDPAVTMLCGGEALPRPLADQLLDRGGALWNMYGPTETTIWSAALRVTRAPGPVLIGPPIANTQFYVLDAAGQLAPPGFPGELYIGGDGVARGYFKRPELTRERFIDDGFRDVPGARLYRTGDIVRLRAGGSLEFLGRTDHQVKLRGFRIELDEIAAVLLAQPGVADAVVISAADAAGDPSIRAFVVAHAGGLLDTENWPARLRARIAEFLPAYMLPAAIVVLDRLPRTPNGKIDRRALPQKSATQAGSASADDPPQTPTEIAIASLVAELLGSSSIGRTDDLFSLGLHSLLAVRLVARIAQRFEIDLPVRTVFERPTIGAVAGSVDHARRGTDELHEPAGARQASRPIVIYNRSGSEPPFVYFHNDDVADGMHCYRLASAIGATQPFVAVAPYGSAGLPALTSIEAMARDQLLRLKTLVPTGPYRLGGFCSGGIVAFELGRMLRSQGELVEPIVVINSYAPQRFALPAADLVVRRLGLDRRLHSVTREKICLNIARFAMCVDRGPAAIGRFLSARIATMFELRERARAYALHPDNPVQIQGTAQTEGGIARLVAELTYHPKGRDGEIALIWSRAEEPAMGDPMKGDPTMGWAAVAKTVRVIPVEGGHYSPIREYVDELGALIADVYHLQQRKSVV